MLYGVPKGSVVKCEISVCTHSFLQKHTVIKKVWNISSTQALFCLLPTEFNWWDFYDIYS